MARDACASGSRRTRIAHTDGLPRRRTPARRSRSSAEHSERPALKLVELLFAVELELLAVGPAALAAVAAGGNFDRDYRSFFAVPERPEQDILRPNLLGEEILGH